MALENKVILDLKMKMQTKIEGILLSKSPYRNRDLICRILLRSGKKVSVLFYGGKGGGRQQKTSILEFGYLIKIELRRNTRSHSELFVAQEWALTWKHKNIRRHYQAFYLLCSYIEMIDKISLGVDLYDENTETAKEDQEGLFRVLSNGLYYLEEAASNKQFYSKMHLFIFLAKLLAETGVSPQMMMCTFCETKLENHTSGLSFNFVHGGFICGQCQSQAETSEYTDGSAIYRLLKISLGSPFKDYKKIASLELKNSKPEKQLFHYFCYQFQLEAQKFKSLQLVL